MKLNQLSYFTKMVHLKKINSTLLLIVIIISFSCALPERNCDDFHSGKFYSETEINGIKYKTIFSRDNSNIQVEKFEDKMMYSSACVLHGGRGYSMVGEGTPW